MKKIHSAAKRGDLLAVRAELSRLSPSDSVRDPQGNTPLHWAAMGGNASVVRFLLANGAELLRNQEGYSALDLAICAGHSRVVRILLERGVNANGAPGRGLAPLHIAAVCGKGDIVKTLLRYGASATRRDGGRGGHTPLHYAAQEGHARSVAILIKSDAPIDSRSGGFTPLALAVCGGHVAAVRTLLAVGADPNARCPPSGNDTPLHMACLWNATDAILKLLLEWDADPRLRRRDGATPAMVALERGKLGFVRLLKAAEKRCGR